MLDLIFSIFDTAQFIPHGMCLLWRPDLLFLHGGSDLMIALAYFTIPLIILRAKEKRPDLIDPTVARMFAGFITACALSHTGAFLTLWFPAYALQGFVKLATAGISIYTAVQLARLMPMFLSLPSHDDLVRKNAQILLGERKIEEAKEVNERLSEFAHIASHDLKAPLRGISNQAKFLEMDHGDTLAPQALSRLERIGELCEQVETSISTLMRYSRINNDAAHTPINMQDFIGEVVESMSEFLAEHNAQVLVDPSLPDLSSDPAQIDTVFRNLIVNAVTYNTSERKEVSIGHVKHVALDGQTIRDAYYVQDNGIGIPEEFRDTVFKMFKRLHSDAVYGAGSGAGLAFVKKVIGSVQGAVGLTSNVGKGSTFYVSFTDQTKQGTTKENVLQITPGEFGHST